MTTPTRSYPQQSLSDRKRHVQSSLMAATTSNDATNRFSKLMTSIRFESLGRKVGWIELLD